MTEHCGRWSECISVCRVAIAIPRPNLLLWRTAHLGPRPPTSRFLDQTKTHAAGTTPLNEFVAEAVYL
jgi:hypothetical protein